MSDISEDRSLTAEEANLVRWLLLHGTDEADRFLGEVGNIRVVARCGCGCASIDFTAEHESGMDILSDYQWRDDAGCLYGVFLFARAGRLAGLEVWSIDGAATPSELPDPSRLEPLDQNAV